MRLCAGGWLLVCTLVLLPIFIVGRVLAQGNSLSLSLSLSFSVCVPASSCVPRDLILDSTQ
jgi:hypothetical protein